MKYLQVEIGNEKVNVKKDMFGWRVVNPVRDENNKIIWLNLLIGGWRNFFILLFTLIIVGAIMYSYNHDVNEIQKVYSDIAKDPVAFCKDVNSGKSPYSFNISELNLTVVEGSTG